MKIDYRTFIFSILIIISFGVFTKTMVFAQSQDQVTIASPKSDTIIRTSDDKVKIEWVMSDDKQISKEIDFQIALSPDSCQSNSNVTYIIATNDSQVNVNSNNFTYEWNVSDTNDKQVLDNGDYCLQVCATLINPDDELYGVCDKKDITIDTNNDGNQNSAPIIISQPKNLNIKTGNKYSYQVVAQDADQDKLYYYMSIGPEFMTVNKDTGVVTSIGGLITEGLYEIKIVVQDNKGGWDEQLFIIKISDKPFYDLDFIEPNKHTTFSTSETNIIWSISPTENVDSINLAYTQDGIKWVNIDTLEADKLEYKWNISTISSGSYYIKLLIADKSGELYEVISDRFDLPVIQKNDSDISLTIDYPKNDTLINELNPTITFIAVPSENANINIDDINVKLENIDLICTYEQQLVSCHVVDELAYESYTVNVVVKDSENKEKSLSWGFTVGEEINNDPSTSSIFGNVSKSSVYLAGLILCIGVVVLFVSWIIYYKKRHSNKEFGDINITTNPVEENIATPVVDIVYPNVDTNESTNIYDTQPQVTPVENFTTSIGEQTLGDDAEYDNYGVDNVNLSNKDNGNSLVSDDVGTSELSMPSSYSNEEIPEWLKDFESDQPKTSTGDEYSSGAANINAGAKVHDDYGITLNTDDGGSKSN